MKEDLMRYAARMDLSKMGAIMPRRMAHIAQGAPVPPKLDYAANLTARALHPACQKLWVEKVIDREAGAKSFVLSSADGGELARFRAGQFLSFSLEIGGSTLTRAYSLCCPPSWAREGKYMITVKPSEDGFAGNWICANWKVGTEVTASAPLGEFTYTRLRDAKHILGVCGGSGVTPFYAMAAALNEGSEDFSLTLLYGSRDTGSILLGEELKTLAAKSERFRVVNVLENGGGGESGYITTELLQKYAPEGDYSLFVCGPAAMMQAMEKAIAPLGLPERRIRRKTYGVTEAALEAGWPADAAGKTFTLTVKMRDEVFTIPCASGETVLVAMERAGLTPPSRCRSGECGWCRSKLVSGTVFTPERTEHRRKADLAYGYIHPCCSFATSDLTVCVGCE